MEADVLLILSPPGNGKRGQSKVTGHEAVMGKLAKAQHVAKDMEQ